MLSRCNPLTIAAACIALANADNAIAQLAAFGAVNPDNGFPLWYRDAAGTQVDLCITDPTMCGLLAPVQLTNPALPFPLNYGGTFPVEAPYWIVTATIPTNSGGQASLVIGLSGGFLNAAVVPGDQVVFTRLRLRVDNLIAGAIYHVTTPFGTFDSVATTSGRRGINLTQDIGLTPGAFGLALNGAVRSFLRWDAGLPLLDPLGNSYLGDPALPHPITGSPTGNNLFRMDGPSVGGINVNSISTNQFTLAAKITSFPPPVASLTAVPVSGPAPLTVQFTDTTVGPVTARSWDFGDGSNSLAANPSHVYSTPGTYSVSLSVSGPGGSDAVTMPNLITVAVPAPVASFSASPTSGNAPLSVAFTNTSTGAITSQSWNFGDGSSSTLANPMHLYALPGTFTVSLTVTGPGGSNTATVPGLINAAAPPAPTADFSATPVSGSAPLSVAFTDLSSGSIASRAWNFGDGTGSSAASPTHVYNQIGTFTVSLTVTGLGGANTKTVAGMISVAAPTLALSAPAPGRAPGRNIFTATGAVPGSEMFLLWSPTLGSSPVTLRGCTLVTGLDAPLVLGHIRATSATVRWTVNLNRHFAGQTMHAQAVDSGICNASNVVTAIF